MDNLIIRDATEADAAMLADLIRAAFEPYRDQLDPPPGALQETESSLRAWLATGGAVLVLVDGRAVGCVLSQRREDHVTLSRLAVLPEFRGQGLGRTLVARVEERALAIGVAKARRGVRLSLPRLMAFYDRLGYRPIAFRTHSGMPYPTYLILEKDLPAAEPSAPG
jgi:ribosomal protein S18 acetylase RimI-like enzyme